MGTLREPLAALDLHASLPPIGLVFAPSPPTRRRLRLTVAGRSPAPFPLSAHGRWTRFANPSQLRYAFPRRPLSRRGGKMVHDARGPVLRGCPCPESRRVTTSEARMAKRGRHRVSGCQEGIRERPANGAWATPSGDRRGYARGNYACPMPVRAAVVLCPMPVLCAAHACPAFPAGRLSDGTRTQTPKLPRGPGGPQARKNFLPNPASSDTIPRFSIRFRGNSLDSWWRSNHPDDVPGTVGGSSHDHGTSRSERSDGQKG
jgi:hypothetical protein